MDLVNKLSKYPFNSQYEENAKQLKDLIEMDKMTESLIYQDSTAFFN